MDSSRVVRRLALGVAVGAFSGMGFLALSSHSTTPISDTGLAAVQLPAAPGSHYGN